MVAFAFLGPALGRHEGWVTTQGEVLAGLFAAEGHPTFVSSTELSPLRRAADHARDLYRWRRRIDVAVVSVFSGRAFALADESLSLARTLRVPSVAWLHGGDLPVLGRRHPRWVGRVLRSADAVVAPSAYLGRWADAFVDDVRVIPNVLDLSDYEFRVRSPLRPRVLWMRTFHELYDPASAVRVLASLRDSGVDARLTMAGQDKGLLDETRALAEGLQVEGFVRFPGFVSGDQKAALFRDHDIFLNTNVVDNAPVTVLEAAASGLVVVSTNVGGVPDLLADGEAALLVPARAPEAMAMAVRGVLDQPDHGSGLAVGARLVAEGSAWTGVRDQWLGVADRIRRT